MTGKLGGKFLGRGGKEWIQINEAYANILLPLKLKEKEPCNVPSWYAYPEWYTNG